MNDITVKGKQENDQQKQTLIQFAKTLEEKKVQHGVKLKTQDEADEESQVVVHCTFVSSEFDQAIRIWKSTYLLDRGSDHRSELVSAFNVSMYPVWTRVRGGHSLQFTLVFTGLPKSCTAFDLIEIIPQSGGFVERNIPRNEKDVYRIQFG
jgi:hypothetical protein